MLRKPDDAESVYYVAQQYLDEMPSCLVEMGNVLANRGQMARWQAEFAAEEILSRRAAT
jgi:hypothetical protein